MLPSSQGAFRLFRLFGIQVFLHWSWFVLAYFRFETGKAAYTNPLWMLGEYVTLFAIVLMHEFGHSLACRSMGGTSDQIILWPFGGIAFVRPPHRPGANLWSIAAGPLVNVALIPVLYAVRYFVPIDPLLPFNDAAQFVDTIIFINWGLLIFNLLPIFPLDGGQIFQSILWYFTGYAKSVLIAAGVGVVAGAGAIAYALLNMRWWLAFIAFFLVSQSWRSWKEAREIRRYEKAQRDHSVIDV
jgi:Zn-dependent protease